MPASITNRQFIKPQIGKFYLKTGEEKQLPGDIGKVGRCINTRGPSSFGMWWAFIRFEHEEKWVRTTYLDEVEVEDDTDAYTDY